MSRYTGKKCRLVSMFALTTAFFFVELIVGYITNSMALVADSFHMLSDIAALIVAFLSVRMAPKSWSKNTFGWARAEVLGALVNGVFLMALCFSITVESLKRFYEPEEIHDPKLLLVVGAIGLVVNLVGLGLFHEHGHSHGGKSNGHTHSHSKKENKPKKRDSMTSTDTSVAKIDGVCEGEGGVAQNQNPPPASPTLSCTSAPSTVLEGVGSEENDDKNKLCDTTEDQSLTKTLKKCDEKSGKQNSKTKKCHTSPSDSNIGPNGNGGTGTSPTGTASQMNMRGVFLHVLADALGSVIVIISALIMWLYTDFKYRLYVDPALSIILVGIMIRGVWPLLIESSMILLQTVPTHIEINTLKDKLLNEVDGILAVHEFHVWQLTGDKIVASAHIRCLNLSQYMSVAEKIKTFFHHEGIHSTTIQPEFVEENTVTSATCDQLSSPQERHSDGSMTTGRSHWQNNDLLLLQHEDCVLSCPKGSSESDNAFCEASKCCKPTTNTSNSSSASLLESSNALTTPRGDALTMVITTNPSSSTSASTVERQTLPCSDQQQR